MALIRNIAGYKFTPLSELPALRRRLFDRCRSLQLKGTILLSPEGINLFIAGHPDHCDAILEELRALPGLAGLEVKSSESREQPFTRLLVRIKKEIIAFGIPGIDPGVRTSPKLAPKTLKQWLDEGRSIVLLDTRNDYEVRLGTFTNARPIGIRHFRDFPGAVGRLPSTLRNETIVMFCTGGVRCEKAGPFMEREGFKHVYQLDGGILKYFEECGGAHYNGECFVFDQRVGIDPNLRETQSALCFACLSPLTPDEQSDPRYVPGRSCPHCHKSPEDRLAITLQRRRQQLKQAISPLPGSAPYENFRPFRIPRDCAGHTLLDALCRILPQIPRDEWLSKCLHGLILTDCHEPVPPDRPVNPGERYLHCFPQMTEPPVNGAIGFIHEDEALIVLDKPAPLPMHAGGRFNRNTLQYILNLVYRPEKPRPAHRLDANTTGLVVFTRARRFASFVQSQFAGGTVEKRYLVKVIGTPPDDEFVCDAPISSEPGELGSRRVDPGDGLPARTEFRVLGRVGNGATLLEARPRTGRTNQIRIHLQFLGFPVAGDPVYVAGERSSSTQTLSPGDPQLCLHAHRIVLVHPITRRTVEFTAPPPDWTRG